MRMTSKGQVTIPFAMRKKHGLLPRSEVQVMDQAGGVLVVRTRKHPAGKQALAALLRGGRIKARTDDWLRLTRGEE